MTTGSPLRSLLGTTRTTPLSDRLARQGVNRAALVGRLEGTHQPRLSQGFYALIQAAVPAVPGVAVPVAHAVQPQGEAIAGEYRVVLIDTDAVAANPHLPQAAIDEQAIERLAQSIREQGILEPLQVMPATDAALEGRRGYWIISGERRRRAAIKAGLQRLPVIIREVTPKAGLQMFLSQYLHNYPVSILARARGFAKLTSEMGMTVQEVAERVGAPAEQIETELAFLGLEEPIQESLEQGRLQSDQASILAKAPDRTTRMALWQYALRYGPSTERLAERLDELLSGRP